MHPIHPADELADIRAEIARLHRREAELRAILIATPRVQARLAPRPGWPMRRNMPPAAVAEPRH